VTDTRAPSQLSKGELRALRLAENFDGGDYNGAPQVAMMVRAIITLGLRLGFGHAPM
jgi:hypothetical protein